MRDFKKDADGPSARGRIFELLRIYHQSRENIRLLLEMSRMADSIQRAQMRLADSIQRAVGGVSFSKLVRVDSILKQIEQNRVQ